MASSSSPVAALGFLTLCRWAVWFGIFSGLGHAATVGALRLLSDRLVLVSSDVIWMAPIADAVVFLLTALVLWVVSARLSAAVAIPLMMAAFVFLLVIGPVLLIPRIHFAAKLILAVGLAVQAARMFAGRFEAIDAGIRRSLPVLAGIWLALALGMALVRLIGARAVEASLPPAAPGAPNVVLIVLDTVRASSLGLYGYGRPTSPNLDRLAREGVVFERALAASPWTLPSHASAFTGRLPQHLSANWLQPLDTKDATLAERFASLGYATAGFSANVLYATAETGLGRGFHHYADYPWSAGMILRESWLTRPLATWIRRSLGIREPLVRKRASEVNAEFAHWLKSRPRRPFFAFLNYFDAHAPYLPPPPFDTKFGRGGPQPDPMVRRQWSPEEIQRSMDAYDGALAYVDEGLGRLFDQLRDRQLADNTLVVVTSDHGEQFGEHGLFDHGNGLYRQALHVPLVIRFPGRVPAGVRIGEPISLTDLGVSILQLSAGDGAAQTFPGRSLVRYWKPDKSGPATSLPVFAEVRRGINLPAWLPASKGTMQSVVIDGVHYIRNGDGTEELYDFDFDPAEQENLAGRADRQAALTAARKALADVMRQR